MAGLISGVLNATLLCSLSMCSLVQAQPTATHTRAQEIVGETVADRPSDHYIFETHHLTSADGERRYRLQLGIPKTLSPASTVLYMLDGNAAIATLTDDDLKELASRNPPVLAAIGYDVATRNDIESRAYDYTPPVWHAGRPDPHPVVRGRKGGGADIFLDFIEKEVKPLTQTRSGTAGKEMLWGHSYGGLFAIHAMFTRPESFAHAIAGDPSAWWHHGALIREWQAMDKASVPGMRLDILVGTRPRQADRPAPSDIIIQLADGREVAPRDALREMAQGLSEHGASVLYREFQQFGHGEMIRASLEHALRVASEP